MKLTSKEEQLKKMVGDKAYLMGLRLGQINTATMERKEYRKAVNEFLTNCRELTILAESLEEEAWVNG